MNRSLVNKINVRKGETLVKILMLIISAIMTCIPVTSLYAQSVTIQYGTVTGVTTVSKDAKHAGGAMAGGIIGAMIGPRRHRGLRAVAGAGIGACRTGICNQWHRAAIFRKAGKWRHIDYQY